MKLHQKAASAIAAQSLILEEFYKPTWTGGLTTKVTYRATDTHGNTIGRVTFNWDRHPAYYQKLGLKARVGTQRHAALSQLVSQLLP